MAEDSRQIAAMLLPLSDELLLLPGTVIAEVVPYNEPVKTHENAPDWYMGEINWRGRQVPIASFERANGAAMRERGHETRFAILNGVSGQEGMPFYGVPVQGIPRSIKLDSSDLSVDKEKETKGKPVTREQVRAAGTSANIPDLDKLEEQLSAFA